MSYFKSIYLTDSTGTPIEVETVGTNHYLGTTVLQDVHLSDVNSSTANLTSGSTFTGTSDPTTAVAGIQVNLKTDQNCTVYIEQSMDNTNWDLSDSFNYYYSLGGASWTVQATASYVRVRVTNNGASTTTYFRLQTLLCPTVEAVPRALTSDGRMKSEDTIVDSETLKALEITPLREVKTIEPTRLVGVSFGGTTKDTNFWSETVTGSGAVSQAGQATLTTGVTANSTVKYASVRIARFIPSSVCQFRAIARFTTAGTTNNLRRIGCYDANEGFFFQLNGTTFSVGARKSAADTLVNSGSFNGNLGAVYTLNTSPHRFIIVYSNLSAQFFIDDKLIHTISSSTDPSTNTLNFPITMENNNSGGGTTAVTFDVRVASITRLGQLVTESASRNITTATTTVCKVSAGRLHKICLNSPSQQSGIVTVYDNTSATGTILATLQWIANNSQLPQAINYDIPFSTGLTVVTSQATNITVAYE